MSTAPQVVTIGSTLQFDEQQREVLAVTLVGSIDTPGTVWFSYGVDKNLGTNTIVASASAHAASPPIPQTFTATLTGLASRPYFFAAVGHNLGGTTVGNIMSFDYVLPTSPATPSSTVSAGTISGISIPHLAWPFKVVFGTKHTGSDTSNDGAMVVQQDSDGDIYACVSTVLACQVGQWPEGPSFGIYDQAFQLSDVDETGAPVIDNVGIASTIARWEPRATPDIITRAIQDDPSTGDWIVSVNV